MISRLILCAVGAYFLLIAGYALAQADLFAFGLHRQMRYVVGPGLLGLGLVMAGWLLRPSRRLLAAIYSASIMATLFAFEGLLTAQTLKVGSSIAAENEAEAAGETAFRESLPPNFTLKGLNADLGVDSPSEVLLGGIPDRDVLLCRNEDGPVIYHSDRYGFRNDDRVHDRPIDLLLLGDSFSEGYCLRDGDHFADRLGALGLAVMNTGSRGAGPLFELAVLERFGPRLRPPLTVMMFYGGNDWENLEHAMPVEWLASAIDGAYRATPLLPEPERLAEAQSVIDGWWVRDTSVLGEQIRKVTWLRNIAALQKTAETLGLHFPRAPVEIAGFERIYERAADTVEGWGGRLLVVYIPPVEQFTGLFSFRGAFDELPQLLEDVTRQAGIGYLDLSGPFYETQEPAALYASDGHFNRRGASLAAELVNRELEHPVATIATSDPPD